VSQPSIDRAISICVIGLATIEGAPVSSFNKMLDSCIGFRVVKCTKRAPKTATWPMYTHF
jgi:hypothetical protein